MAATSRVRPGPRLLLASLLAVLLGLGLLAATPAGAGPWAPKLLLFDSGGELDDPSAIVADGGDVWIASSGNDAIALLDPPADGGSSEDPAVGGTPVPTDYDLFTDVDGEVDHPQDLAVLPDGDVVFTSAGNDRLGRLDPDTGDIETITDPEGEVDFPQFLVVEDDGDIWFSSLLNDRIGRLQPNGTITTVGSPQLDAPRELAIGPDGGIWFTSNASDRLGRVNPANGNVTTFADPSGQVDAPYGLTVGPDGRLWFTMQGSADPNTTAGVGAFDPSTQTFEVFTGAPFDAPFDITTGADGNLWVTDSDAGLIRVTPDGAATAVLDDDSGVIQPARITSGPAVLEDGSSADGTAAVHTPRLWFTDLVGAQVGALDPDVAFTDVDLSHPFLEEVEWMAAQEISEGYADGTYRPSLAVTRQAMSAFMYRLAGLFSPTMDITEDPAVAPSFSDVPEAHPFFLEIEWMATNGISEGYADGTYRPSAAVTRQAMSAFMYRLFLLVDEDVSATGSEPTSAASFSDVPDDHPFSAEIQWMADNQISEGYANGTYRPSLAVTRQAMSAFMFRLGLLLDQRMPER